MEPLEMIIQLLKEADATVKAEFQKLIFPALKQWVDSLMHLAFFLHSEGVKMSPKLDRYSYTSEPDSTVCHEDEALFGDLFSEGGCYVGSVEGNDQSIIAASSVTNVNMPLHAASELFIFLKTSVFSREWNSSIYEDARKELNTYCIDIILSAHSCQGCYGGDRTSDVGYRKYVHALEVHNLISFNAISRSLDEYIVCKILTIENGSYIYHTLIYRVDLSGNQLRTKVHKVFVEFVSEKVKSVCARCPSLKKLIETLPSVFHIEILVISFHLSSAEGKAVQADFIFSSIKTIERLSNGFNSTHLSCWELLVSRLVMILGHMIFYPNVCPPTLLSELKSKLKEAPLVRSSLPGNLSNRTFWASTSLENMKQVLTIEGAVSSSFMNWLIDTAVNCLGLSSAEVCPFSWILEFWRGKGALTVVLEPSIFLNTSDANYVCPADNNEGFCYLGAGGGSKRRQQEEADPATGKRPCLEHVEQDPFSNLFPNLELRTVPKTIRGTLLERIARTDLDLQRIEGDGNCQFRSVSKVLTGTQEHYMKAREKVVDEMTKNPHIYMDYGTSLEVPGWRMWEKSYYDNYVRNMAKDRVWGDYITLFAAANVFQVRVNLYCSFKHDVLKEFVPVNQLIYKDVYLAYTYHSSHVAHYEAMMPPNDIIALKPTLTPERTPRKLVNVQYRVIVKNISFGATSDHLRGLFSTFGRVVDARIIYTSNGYSRGFGFVVVENEHMMETAIATLNGKLWLQREIRVSKAMENYHDLEADAGV